MRAPAQAMMVELSMRVSIDLGWLSENGMIKQALSVAWAIEQADLSIFPDADGVKIMSSTHGSIALSWSDRLEFTLSQLLELGFDPGDTARIMSELLR